MLIRTQNTVYRYKNDRTLLWISEWGLDKCKNYFVRFSNEWKCSSFFKNKPTQIWIVAIFLTYSHHGLFSKVQNVNNLRYMQHMNQFIVNNARIVEITGNKISHKKCYLFFPWGNRKTILSVRKMTEIFFL